VVVAAVVAVIATVVATVVDMIGGGRPRITDEVRGHMSA